MSELKQECGSPRCPNYGLVDGPNHPCPDDHIMDRHPAADDPKWKPSTYQYYDSALVPFHITQTPIDDEAALMEFHRIREWGVEAQFVAKKQDDGTFKMLPYRFIDGGVIDL